MSDCKHAKLQTWHCGDDGIPAGMWSCVACGRKFVPVDIAQENDAERYRWLREHQARVTYTRREGEDVSRAEVENAQHWTRRLELDAAIDATMLAAPGIGAA